MIQYKPKMAIEAIAYQLPNLQVRGAASKALIALGSDAEEVVIPHLESYDHFELSSVCEILRIIGTKKSIPVLEKLATDRKRGMARNAERAIEAIKLRQRLQPTSK